MRTLATAAVLFALTAVPDLFAHNWLPETPGSAVTMISDISVSRAAYRVLASGDKVDLYEFTASKGQELYIQMTVPYLERMQGFAPGFVLVYAGGEAASGGGIAASGGGEAASRGGGPAGFEAARVDSGRITEAPREVLDAVAAGEQAGSAAIAVVYDAPEPTVFDEHVTGTRYWIRQTLTVSAPADGVYRIGVYSPERQTGKYVLAPGRAEKFSFADILSLPAVRWKVREFCEEPLWPDVLLWTTVGAAVVGGIAFGVYKVVQR